MKILFICHEYPPKPFGGIGSFTKLMAERLTEQGVTVGVIGYGPENKNSILDENGVLVYRIAPPNTSSSKYLSYLNQFKDRFKFHSILKKHVHSFQPDIIETYEWTGPLLFKIKGIKLVTRLHGSNTANNEYMCAKRNPLTAYFEKRTIQKADYILSVSNHIAKITQQSFRLNFKYQIIHNGVDINLFSPQNVKRDQNKIILVGRMHPYKGFNELFAALNQLFTLNKNVYFEIVCSIIEDYKDKILAKVDSSFHHRVRFVGRVPNEKLKDYYSSANLSILPSLSEAFPIIPLESMSCETPVIMSNRFSSTEIIEDNVDGFLVEVNQPTNFANQIANILNNQEHIEELRQVARKKMELKFEINKIVAENLNFYSSITHNA